MAHKHKNQLHPPAFYSPAASTALTIGLFFAAQVLASIFIGLVFLGAGWSDNQAEQWFSSSALAQLVFVGLSSAIVFGGIAFLLKRKKLSLRSIGLKRFMISDVGRALLGYGLYLVSFIIITAAAKAIFPSLDLEQEQFNFDAINRTTANLIFLFISLVILPPLIEEILCRGFLYTGLRSKLKIVPSAIVTSLIFAAAHLQFGNGTPLLWVAGIDTFVLSLVLVYLREKTGRLTAPIVLHGLKNFVAFTLLFLVA